MPRLGYPAVSQFAAKTTLLEVYFGDQEFVRELASLNLPYAAVIQTATIEMLEYMRVRGYISKDRYESSIRYYGKKGNIPLTSTNEDAISARVTGYLQALDGLGRRWRLAASWVPCMLFVETVLHEVVKTGIGEINWSFDKFVSLYRPWLTYPD